MECSEDTNRPRVGLLMAAHAPLAHAMLHTAKEILGERWGSLSQAVEAVDIVATEGTQRAFEAIASAIDRVDEGAGVLVLADLFGGSAANIALAQLGAGRVEVVTGANLAMLLEALSRREEWGAPTILGKRVAEAARQSVVVAGPLLSDGSSREEVVA